jgi:hypothetical protein
MKTITLRGIDEELSSALTQAARRDEKSINQFVLDRLRSDVGLKKEPRFTATYHDLDDLFGSWSEDEYRRIDSRLMEQRAIDPRLW